MTVASFTKAMGQDESGTERASIEAPFGLALTKAAAGNPSILGLTADLGKYTDILPFRDAFRDRFFNVGMAEQNLVGIAAGLARTGFIPFATTYGVFASRRAYDYVAIACAHSSVNVKIIAGLPGLTTGYGGTHQAIEDTGLMCMIPGLVVIDPCDATEIMSATAVIADYDGPVYMRLLRGKVPVVLDASYRFEIGKARLLRTGSDVGFISTGFMTERALDAAALIEQMGLSAGVLHVPTLKPLDTEAIAAFAVGKRVVITAENHVIRGGLATMTAEALFDKGVATPLRRIGLPDRFIECGVVARLQEQYGITTANLVAVAAAAVE